LKIALEAENQKFVNEWFKNSLKVANISRNSNTTMEYLKKRLYRDSQKVQQGILGRFNQLVDCPQSEKYLLLFAEDKENLKMKKTDNGHRFSDLLFCLASCNFKSKELKVVKPISTKNVYTTLNPANADVARDLQSILNKFVIVYDCFRNKVGLLNIHGETKTTRELIVINLKKLLGSKQLLDLEETNWVDAHKKQVPFALDADIIWDLEYALCSGQTFASRAYYQLYLANTKRYANLKVEKPSNAGKQSGSFIWKCDLLRKSSGCQVLLQYKACTSQEKCTNCIRCSLSLLLELYYSIYDRPAGVDVDSFWNNNQINCSRYLAFSLAKGTLCVKNFNFLDKRRFSYSSRRVEPGGTQFIVTEKDGPQLSKEEMLNIKSNILKANECEGYGLQSLSCFANSMEFPNLKLAEYDYTQARKETTAVRSLYKFVFLQLQYVKDLVEHAFGDYLTTPPKSLKSISGTRLSSKSTKITFTTDGITANTGPAGKFEEIEVIMDNLYMQREQTITIEAINQMLTLLSKIYMWIHSAKEIKTFFKLLFAGKTVGMKSKISFWAALIRIQGGITSTATSTTRCLKVWGEESTTNHYWHIVFLY
jgi:hypothetical protein